MRCEYQCSEIERLRASFLGPIPVGSSNQSICFIIDKGDLHSLDLRILMTLIGQTTYNYDCGEFSWASLNRSTAAIGNVKNLNSSFEDTNSCHPTLYSLSSIEQRRFIFITLQLNWDLVTVYRLPRPSRNKAAVDKHGRQKGQCRSPSRSGTNF